MPLDPDLLRLANSVASAADQEEAFNLAPFLPASDAEALVIVVLTRLAVEGVTA